MRRVAIFGGAFDPPHHGHLYIAREVQKQLQFDEIRWIPTNIPPHKRSSDASSADRLAMLQLLIAGEENFTISTIELDKPGPSYTIDTVRLLKQMEPDVHFSFLIGADMIEYLPKWKAIDELVQIIDFVGVARLTYNGITEYPVQMVEVPVCDISSSEIREKVKLGLPIDGLVPESIASYIKEHKLYGTHASN